MRGAARSGRRPGALLPQHACATPRPPRVGTVERMPCPHPTILQTTEEFLAAHAERKIPKKWVADKIKEYADRQHSTGWVLKPAALSLLGVGQGASAGPAGAAAAGQAAAQQPVPAAVGAAQAGGALNRFLVKQVWGRQWGGRCELGVHRRSASQQFSDRRSSFTVLPTQGPTPAGAAALKPAAPPSDLKAPGRLVTNTAAGQAGRATKPAVPLPPLEVPEAVSGTSDPYWRALLAHIEAADGPDQEQQQPPAFAAAFQPARLQQHASSMPAHIPAALLSGLCSDGVPAAAKAVEAQCLLAAVAFAAASSGACAPCGVRRRKFGDSAELSWNKGKAR